MRKITALVIAFLVMMSFGVGHASANTLTFNDIQASNSESLVYGWSWDQVVQVYDATPAAANWQVAEAAHEWGLRNGLVTEMTTDSAQAEITVTEVVTTGCGSGAVGCAHFPPVSNGVAYGNCLVELVSNYGYEGVSEHIAIHEIGHCLGLAHADTTRSVMYFSVNRYEFLTRPTAYDYKDMRALYGR